MKKITRNFIYLVLFAFLIWCFVYLGKKDFSSTITDAERFSKEYTTIDTDNPFVYVNSNRVLNILNNETGIILVGFSSNAWMQEYVRELYPVLKENNITKVYYYDVIEDRTKKTKNFRQIEDLLSKYLKITDMGINSSLSCLISIFVGIIIYMIAIMLLKVFRLEEIKDRLVKK